MPLLRQWRRFDASRCDAEWQPRKRRYLPWRSEEAGAGGILGVGDLSRLLARRGRRIIHQEGTGLVTAQLELSKPSRNLLSVES